MQASTPGTSTMKTSAASIIFLLILITAAPSLALPPIPGVNGECVEDSGLPCDAPAAKRTDYGDLLLAFNSCPLPQNIDCKQQCSHDANCYSPCINKVNQAGISYSECLFKFNVPGDVINSKEGEFTGQCTDTTDFGCVARCINDESGKCANDCAVKQQAAGYEYIKCVAYDAKVKTRAHFLKILESLAPAPGTVPPSEQKAELGREDIRERTAMIGEKVGAIANMRGIVEVEQPDGTWKPLRKGESIFMGNRIRTGQDGRVQVLLLDDTVFTMGSGGAVEIDQSLYDPLSPSSKLFIRIINGVFRFVTGGIQRRDCAICWKFGTRSGDIGIRGTDFIADTANDRTTIHTLEGVVEFTLRTTNETVSISRGNSFELQNDTYKIIPLTDDKKKALLSSVEISAMDPRVKRIITFATIGAVLGILLAIILRIVKKQGASSRKDRKE